MKKIPLLSVLMTCYNREKYIGEAIESVLKSGFDDFELIIVDDCSSDNSVKIAMQFEGVDQRIKVYRNQSNLGDYPNRNRAASFATGEFLMFVDSDDKILEQGFMRCIDAMQQFPGAGIGMLLKEHEGEPFYLSHQQAIRLHFFTKPCLMIGPGGTILRRSFFESLGKYPVKYGPANDLYFNLKAAAVGGMVFLPFSFNFYRIHDGQEFNNHFGYLYNNYCYLQAALSDLPLSLTGKEKEWISNKNKRRFLVNLVQYMFRSGSISQVARARKLAAFGWRDAWKALVHPSL